MSSCLSVSKQASLIADYPAESTRVQNIENKRRFLS